MLATQKGVKLLERLTEEERKRIKEKALEYHRGNIPLNGKIEVIPKVKVENFYDLSLAYTPGVAEVCRAISKGADVRDYTSVSNTVAVVTDGTAVLGLGDIGVCAGMPVMEGKCVLFKIFAGVDAFPILVDSRDVDQIVNTVKLISKGFGGINLEDISAPRCFEIEERLQKELDIPVFHDDQHGTAVVTLAALMNALKIVGKRLENLKIAISGAGAAGIAIAKLLKHAGAQNIILVDRRGTLYPGRANMNRYKEEVALYNVEGVKGGLDEALKGADVFIGVSAGGILRKEHIRKMAKDPIVFAMANPVPEIDPKEAKEAGARIVATGRSDYPNQVNNALGFPGIFRGVLDTKAREITLSMKIEAAKALAESVPDKKLREDYIIPSPFEMDVHCRVAGAVAERACKDGVARAPASREEVEEHTKVLQRFFADHIAKLNRFRKDFKPSAGL